MRDGIERPVLGFADRWSALMPALLGLEAGPAPSGGHEARVHRRETP